jgi:hypothetical protein
MSEDRPYDIDATYKDSKTKKEISFKFRRSRWLEDHALQQKLVTPEGQINLKELWIARITDTVEGIDAQKIRQLDSFTMNVYIAKWLEYNDVTEASFLEVQKPTV